MNVLDIERAECALFVGTNPAASHQLNMPQSSPTARIKQARKHGLQIIAIDPRRSDVARMDRIWEAIRQEVQILDGAPVPENADGAMRLPTGEERQGGN